MHYNDYEDLENTVNSGQIGTSTVGSGTKFIYLNSGKPTATSSTVGSSTNPVYLNSGTITACGTTAKSTRLANYYSTRPEDCNITQDGSGDMVQFRATGSMTTNKPPGGDGHVLHFFWDATSGYDAQLAIGNGNHCRIEIRGMKAGDWTDWYEVARATSGSATGGSTTPVYINSSGMLIACTAEMPITGSTFTGIAYAQSNTSYTTYQLRNIAFTTSTPSSLTNGNVCMVYS